MYRLIDENEYAIYEFRVDDKDGWLSGTLWEINGWDLNNNPSSYNFMADICIKWDLCSHWNFYGEDYFKFEDGEETEQDSYYHICGGRNYIDFMRGMSFVCELAKMNIDCCDNKEFDIVLSLNLLDGLKIVEVEEG